MAIGIGRPQTLGDASRHDHDANRELTVAAPTVRTVPAGPHTPPTDPAAEDGTDRGSDFAGLLRQVRSAGLLRRRPGYYAVKITATAALLAAAWTGFALLGDSWWQLTVAASLA